MRVIPSLLVLVILPVLVAGVAGDVAAGDDPKHAALEGVAIEGLAWMTGYWKTDKRGIVNEECWLAPKGNVMLGLHRDTYEDGRMMFEYLRIMETANGVVYYATPLGYETTKFTLTAHSNKDGVRRAVFENPEHDFPKLIRYTLNGDLLTAEAEGIDDGQRVVEVWTWTRSEFPD